MEGGSGKSFFWFLIQERRHVASRPLPPTNTPQFIPREDLALDDIPRQFIAMDTRLLLSRGIPLYPSHTLAFVAFVFFSFFCLVSMYSAPGSVRHGHGRCDLPRQRHQVQGA